MRVSTLVPNFIFLMLLGLFSIVVPLGAWQPNPAWILLFARVYGIAFNNVHFTSVAAISTICIYLIIRDRHTIQPFKWVAVVFAGAGIHEWFIFLWDWIILKAPLVAWQDAIWFAAFIVLGVALGNRKQRFVLGALSVYLFALMGIYVGFFGNSDLEIGTYTAHSIADNTIEVLSWVTTALGFLFA